MSLFQITMIGYIFIFVIICIFYNQYKSNRCCRCNALNGVIYRMGTNYHREEDNYSLQCPFCQKITEENWEEMWDDYYSGCM